MTPDTCEGCVYHKRESGERWQEDWCYEMPEPIKRQSTSGYWGDYPRACSRKKEANHE